MKINVQKIAEVFSEWKKWYVNKKACAAVRVARSHRISRIANATNVRLYPIFNIIRP
jgi:hypothetical protein